MATDAVTSDGKCSPSPEYQSLIDFAARHAYSPDLLGNIDKLKSKHNSCDLTSPEQAAEVAGKELEKLHPGIEFTKTEKNEGFVEKAGIGSHVDWVNGRLEIYQTLAGGPAEKAGLKIGDSISAVDGTPIKGLSIRDSIDLLRSTKNEGKENAGIGAGLRREENGPVLINQIDRNSPADKAGLLAGDKIVAIDGKAVVSGTSLVDTVKQLHGAEGSRVSMTISRGGQDVTIALPRTAEAFPQAVLDVTSEGKDFQISVNRNKVELQNVSTALGGSQVVKGGLTVPEGTAYVRIENFASSETTMKLWDALKQSNDAQGTKVGDSDMIIDLRGNTGGRIDDVTLAASLFMDKGSLFQIRQRVDSDPSNPQYQDDEYRLNNKTSTVISDGRERVVNERLPQMKHGKLIVMTDEMTAGTAEMLASALRENAGATILGAKSYGLGEVRMVSSTNAPGGMLSVPIGHIYTSKGQWLGNGRDIKLGLTPDISVPTSGYFGSKQDTQLSRAFKLIEERRK